jgi:SSS family transporter
MNSTLLLTIFIFYICLLFLAAYLTSRKANNESYFLSNRKAPWYLVAYGMIGTSLTGVTFVSVPGLVGTTGFTYFMVVLGYILGYIVIAFVLLPTYYKNNVTSIYEYLKNRFSIQAQKSGSWLFLISRSLGASLRMFIVIVILQTFVLSNFGIPFWLSTIIFLIIIHVYTLVGGVKTIVWTDTIQTTFMIASLILTIYFIAQFMNTNINGLLDNVFNSNYFYIIDSNPASKNFWAKLLISGMFITISMTGLDQEMMQKNLSISTLKNSQKNMIVFSIILAIVDFIFLILGGSLYLYGDFVNIGALPTSDYLFPTISFYYMNNIVGIIFFIGMIAASFSGTDAALTALTTSITIDLLDLPQKIKSNKKLKQYRMLIQWGVSVGMFILIMIFYAVNNSAILDTLFTIAGYTYGPLLGLFAFGLLTKANIDGGSIWQVVLFSPLCSLAIMKVLKTNFQFMVGWEVLVINALITFILLWMIREQKDSQFELVHP